MTLSAGSRLGPYEIVAPLGAGGMGEVYRARDPRLDRDVAVKTLSPHLFHDPDALARFEREARAVAALSHPNILAIFDFGREGNVTYSVTELLEGETLRSALLRGAITSRKAIEVAAALADALAAAHSRGLVHRDLKPENVFLTADGVVKILDFGLVRQTAPSRRAADSTAATLGETTPGTVLGTFGYMSPEQVRGEVADGRSDIFALGCVLYEMFTGDRAFRGATAAETVAAVLRDEPEALRREDGPIPWELRPILGRCLEKHREDRFHSARDLAFALRGTATPTPSRAAGPRPAGGIDSVAVLPFVTAGDDPDFRYLSDGISESLTRALSRIESLRVISRSAVARYREGDLDPGRAGRELGVHAVIVGRVAMRGEKLVIDAELVDVLDGRQIWGQRYERAMSDTYALEEELASDIAEQLRPKLVAAAPATAAFPSVGPKAAAYQLYLKGRYHRNRRPEEAPSRPRRTSKRRSRPIPPSRSRTRAWRTATSPSGAGSRVSSRRTRPS